MVKFKSWDDYRKFMMEYCRCSCFNCIGYVHSDDEFKGRFICMKTLSPVRMDLLHICTEWENKDGETWEKYGDESIYALDDEIVEKIEAMTGEVSFEDILEVANEYGKINQ